MFPSIDQVASQLERAPGIRPKVAFVVQRCGPDVNGGSEAHCLAVARAMQDDWDIEIITTCAKDYMTWENFYPAGVARYESFRIRRFEVDAPRDIADFNSLSGRVLSHPERADIKQGEEWLKAQGPYSSELFAWLKTEQARYDFFVFFTYLYATTAIGIRLVSMPKCLVPTAHDEPPLLLRVYNQVFEKADFLLLNTSGEYNILRKRFPDLDKPYDFAGVGVQIPSQINPQRFREKFSVYEKYVLYVGRIDPSKGCDELFDFWQRFKVEHKSAFKLVLIGQAYMPIPDNFDILHVGFVSETDKWDALCGAELVVNPSPYESLSMVLLESWAVETPTLVTARCEVTVDQSIRSQGGLWYQNYLEFAEMIIYLVRHSLDFEGRKFVETEYGWDAIRRKYSALETKFRQSSESCNL